jgi:hypothetical protein
MKILTTRDFEIQIDYNKRFRNGKRGHEDDFEMKMYSSTDCASYRT